MIKARPKSTATALLACGALVLAAALPASGQAATKFGSKLTTDTQPSNGAPGLKCDQGDPSAKCSFVMNEAYAPPNPDGKQKAPKDGKIDEIDLIAATKGHFKLQIVKVNGDQAKVVDQGPRIDYTGTPANAQNYKIEKFDVNIPIKKGQRLAAKANKISFVRCSSGGDNTLIYDPPLAVNAPFEQSSSSDGCWMLLEAFYK